MSTMRALPLLLGVAFFLAPEVAQACHPADRKEGPNCIWELEFSRRDEVLSSVVYRGDNRRQNVVWNDLGEVIVSTAEKLVVDEWVIDDKGYFVKKRAVFFWDGKQYSRR